MRELAKAHIPWFESEIPGIDVSFYKTKMSNANANDYGNSIADLKVMIEAKYAYMFASETVA